MRDWLCSGGTWFAGVNVLPNDAFGAVSNGPPLGGSDQFHSPWLGPTDLTWDRPDCQSAMDWLNAA
jgi:hypothetical protein